MKKHNLTKLKEDEIKTLKSPICVLKIEPVLI